MQQIQLSFPTLPGLYDERQKKHKWWCHYYHPQTDPIMLLLTITLCWSLIYMISVLHICYYFLKIHYTRGCKSKGILILTVFLFLNFKPFGSVFQICKSLNFSKYFQWQRVIGSAGWFFSSRLCFLLTVLPVLPIVPNSSNTKHLRKINPPYRCTCHSAAFWAQEET